MISGDHQCRDVEIGIRYSRGDTLRRLAIDFSLSLERIRQILRHENIPLRPYVCRSVMIMYSLTYLTIRY